MTEGGRRLADTHPHLRDFEAFLPDFNRESDRGMVMIASSYIDDLLRRTLESFLVAGSDKIVDGFNAPLGTLSTRVAAAFALGLISDNERCEIDRIRKVRNRFAHDLRATFGDAQIRDLCGQLAMAAKPYGDVSVDARAQFGTAAISVILNLVNRPYYVSLKRRAWEPWPY